MDEVELVDKVRVILIETLSESVSSNVELLVTDKVVLAVQETSLVPDGVIEADRVIEKLLSGVLLSVTVIVGRLREMR
jgi:hypothetical protein